MLVLLFRDYSPYKWPQWRAFKVYCALGLVCWWAYFAADLLAISDTGPGGKRDWFSPASIVAGVLFGSTIFFWYQAYQARSGFRLHWEFGTPARERQSRAEVVRQTVGVTIDQVADFRRWRIGAAVVLVVFVVIGVWWLLFGPSASDPVGPINVLNTSWVGAIIVARFLWSARTFGRIFYSPIVPGDLSGFTPVRSVPPRSVPTPVSRSAPEFPPMDSPGTSESRVRTALDGNPITRNPVVRWFVLTVAAFIVEHYLSQLLP